MRKRMAMLGAMILLVLGALIPGSPAAAADTVLAHTCAVIGKTTQVQAVHCADVMRRGNFYYGRSQVYCQQINIGAVIACDMIISQPGSYSSRTGAHYGGTHSCGISSGCTQIRLLSHAPFLTECGSRIRGRAIDTLVAIKGSSLWYGGDGTSVETPWVTQSC